MSVERAVRMSRGCSLCHLGFGGIWPTSWLQRVLPAASSWPVSCADLLLSHPVSEHASPPANAAQSVLASFYPMPYSRYIQSGSDASDCRFQGLGHEHIVFRRLTHHGKETPNNYHTYYLSRQVPLYPSFFLVFFSSQVFSELPLAICTMHGERNGCLLSTHILPWQFLA